MSLSMSTLPRAALRARALLRSAACTPARALCSSPTHGGGGRGAGTGARHEAGLEGADAPRQAASDDADDDELLQGDNVRHISPGEVARLRATLRLVREHVAAREAGEAPPDVESNPLIDPRSFDLRVLPRIDPQVLAAFREELPPDLADEARPVHTGALWEGLTAGATAVSGGGARDAATSVERAEPVWGDVDARTMPQTPRRALAAPRAARRQQGGPADGQQQRQGAQEQLHQFRMSSAQMISRGKQAEQDLAGVPVDFRCLGLLSTYIGDTGKIIPRRRSALTARAQKRVAKAIKTARQMALINPEPRPQLSFEEMIEIDRQLEAKQG